MGVSRQTTTLIPHLCDTPHTNTRVSHLRPPDEESVIVVPVDEDVDLPPDQPLGKALPDPLLKGGDLVSPPLPGKCGRREGERWRTGLSTYPRVHTVFTQIVLPTKSKQLS